MLSLLRDSICKIVKIRSIRKEAVLIRSIRKSAVLHIMKQN